MGPRSTSARRDAWRAPRAWRELLAVREPRPLWELLVPDDPLELRALVAERLEARALVFDARRALVQAFARLAAALRPGLRTRAKGGLGVGPAWLVFVVDEALDALAASLAETQSAETNTWRDGSSARSPWRGEARVLAAFARRPQHERRTAFDILLGRQSLESLARAQRCSVQLLAERTMVCLAALGGANATRDVADPQLAPEPQARGSIDHDDERLLARVPAPLRAPARDALRLLRLVHAVRRGAPGAVEIDEVERALVELERARCAEAVRTLLGAALNRDASVESDQTSAASCAVPTRAPHLENRVFAHEDGPYFETTIGTLRDLAPSLGVPLPPLTPFVEPRALVSGLIESLAALATCHGPRVVATAEVESWRLRLFDLEAEAPNVTLRETAGEPPREAPAASPAEPLLRSARERVDEHAQAVAALAGCSARSRWQLLHVPAATGRRGRAQPLVCAASEARVAHEPTRATRRARSPRAEVVSPLPTPFGAPLELRVSGATSKRRQSHDGEAAAGLLAALEVALASRRDIECGGAGFVLPVDEPGARETARRALELCRGGAPIVLVGPPGSGRRTFARWLHFTWLQLAERAGADSDPSARECRVLAGGTEGELETWIEAAFTAAAIPNAAPVCLGWPDGTRSLESRVTLGGELAARLRASTVRLPALADARQRIPALVLHHLQHQIARGPRPTLRVDVDDDALAALWRAEWPGNGHDLARVVARLAAEVADPARPRGSARRIRAEDVARALESTGLVSVERRPMDCGAHELAAAVWATRTPRGRRNLLRAARWLGWDRGTLADRLHTSARDPAELLHQANQSEPRGGPR